MKNYPFIPLNHRTDEFHLSAVLRFASLYFSPIQVIYVLLLDQVVHISALIIYPPLHAIATYVGEYSAPRPPPREKISFLIYFRVNDNGDYL